MPSKNNLVKPNAYETTPVVVVDVQDSTEEKKLPNGKSIKFPYYVELETKDKKIGLTKDASTATLNPISWKKKFYLNKDDFVSFTRNHDLLAVYTILIANRDIEHNEGEEFDVNSIIGKEFDAVVIANNDYNFIDWVKTFEMNNIAVPTPEELRGVTVTQKTVEGTSEVNPDDLPF